MYKKDMQGNNSIAIIADRLAPPYDEGIKNIAVHFIAETDRLRPVTLITDNGSGIVERTIFKKLGKAFLTVSLAIVMRKLRPRFVFYIPSTSLTFMSFVRAAVVKVLSPGSKTFLVGLQARRLTSLTRMLLKLSAPDGLVVLSERMRREFEGVSATSAVFIPGVDVEKFRPADPKGRAELRKKYGIAQDAFVVLHVGHLKKSRNLQTVVEALSGIPCEFVVVASSTFQHEEDQEVSGILRASGARILAGAIDSIEQIYQLADCYVFPVIERTGATEVPLSVLEAMAANLAVVTTPYGGLVEAFPESRPAGLFYANDVGSFAAALGAASGLKAETRAMVAAYTWHGRVAALMQKLKVTENV